MQKSKSRPTAIQVFLFDFYGVICANTTHLWLRKNVPDIASSMPDYRAILAQNNRGLITKPAFYELIAKRSGFSAGEVERGIERQSNIDQELIQLILRLKAHYKIGILSNSSGHGLRAILEEYRLNTVFDDIIASAETGYIKPEPELYQLALQRFGVDAPQTIFIDDSMQNVDAARRLGIKALYFVSTLKLTSQLREWGVEGV